MSQSDVKQNKLDNQETPEGLPENVGRNFVHSKNARLLGKGNGKERVKRTRKSVAAPVTIVQNDRMCGDAMKGAIMLSEFMQQFSNEKPPKFPHDDFILKNWRITKDHLSPENGTDSNVNFNKRFWAEFGKYIRILTVSGGEVDFITNNTAKEFLPKKLPNVEKLIFLNCKLNIQSLPDAEEAVLAEEQVGQLPPLVSHNYYSFQEAGLDDRHIHRALPYARPQEVQGFGHLGTAIYGRFHRPSGTRDLKKNEMPKGNKATMPKIQQFTQQKLRHISFENVDYLEEQRRLSWKNFISALNNLEVISVTASPCIVQKIFSAIREDTVPKKLKTVDILNMNMPGFEFPWCAFEVSSKILALQKLTLNCGVNTDWSNVHNVMTTQLPSLETLHLYRAPGLQPYPNLPCDFKMPKLTVLHLWGGISNNLNFLQFLPNLKVLKWDATCYAEDNDGLPDCGNMQQPHPDFAKDIVENSNELGADFRLDSVTTLEIEWGPMRLESWQKLGVWMSKVTALKGVMTGDDQFPFILKLWPNLHSIQLAHGSSHSANKSLKGILVRKSFSNLSTFNGKPCPFPRSTAERNLHRE